MIKLLFKSGISYQSPFLLEHQPTTLLVDGNPKIDCIVLHATDPTADKAGELLYQKFCRVSSDRNYKSQIRVADRTQHRNWRTIKSIRKVQQTLSGFA